MIPLILSQSDLYRNFTLIKVKYANVHRDVDTKTDNTDTVETLFIMKEVNT